MPGAGAVALQLIADGVPATPSNIEAAMRATLDRDAEIYNTLQRAEEDAKRRGEDGPRTLLARAIYRRLRGGEMPSACTYPHEPCPRPVDVVLEDTHGRRYYRCSWHAVEMHGYRIVDPDEPRGAGR